jgi:hypothetical protein
MSTTGESNPISSSRTTAITLPRCSCLQQHVQLVYRLSNLDYPSSRIDTSVGRVLSAVQFAQLHWKALMQCESCQTQDNQKEVFLLFAMSVRILLKSTQKVATYASDSRSPASASSGTSASSFLLPDTGSALPVRVGGFELTGSTKDDVIKLALRQALQAIQCALLHLCERSPNSRSHLSASVQSPSHRSRDAGAFEFGSNTDDTRAQFESEASMSSYTMDGLWGTSSTDSRYYDSNVRKSRTKVFQTAESRYSASEDDISSMMRTLQSSMSAVG